MSYLPDIHVLSELQKPQSDANVRRWSGDVRSDLPVDVAVADRWGRLNAPDLLPVTGGLLAATALVHKLTLATRNTRDVERSGVQLLNPFG